MGILVSVRNTSCDALRDLVPFVQFKKREKQFKRREKYPWVLLLVKLQAEAMVVFHVF